MWENVHSLLILMKPRTKLTLKLRSLTQFKSTNNFGLE